MRLILLVLVLTVPTVGFSQSLGEVAKKERERRERNKKEGRKALEFSEVEIFGEPEEGEGEGEGEGSEAGGDTVQERSTSPADDFTISEDADLSEGEVPESIPPDLPLNTRIAMFERMKSHYESQVRELDAEIAKNNKTIADLDAQIRTASSSGGAGLPVAPSAEGASQQYTGQESETLVAERNKLETLNQRLEARKGELKANVIAQGRIANIPASYLRF